MPNLNWSEISGLQLGRIAEYYAQIEFLSHGWEIYDTVVDDRGIDFLARKDKRLLEVQVKSVRRFGFTSVLKSQMPILDAKRVVCYLHFQDGAEPDIYIIPATAWKTPNALLTDRNYAGKKSKPEWGINISRRNLALLSAFEAKKFF